MNSKSTHSFDTVFVLLIFCLFAGSSLFLVLIGANVYRDIVGEMNANNETRASLSYVSNKVRAADSRDVSVEKIDGQDTLVIHSANNGSDYKTYIYLHDGYLMELFTKAENGFTAGDGDKITPVSAFIMIKNDNELSLSVSGGNKLRLSLDLFLS
ncbi:MAG: hypothetical protein K0Q85_533 [Caproiciproducens sp.]|nr:hypothetical protein [Caproiciproducens sp.]